LDQESYRLGKSTDKKSRKKFKQRDPKIYHRKKGSNIETTIEIGGVFLKRTLEGRGVNKFERKSRVKRGKTTNW